MIFTDPAFLFGVLPLVCLLFYQLTRRFGTTAGTSVTPDFPTFMYDDDVLNDLRSVGPESLLAVWRLLSTGTPFQDERPAERTYSARTTRNFERFQTAGAMRSVAKVVDGYRAHVDEPRLSTCDGFPALVSLLVPDLRALSARGIRVDVVISPYSLAMYYRFAADAAVGAARGGTLRLRDQLLMRRRLLEQVSRIPHVRVVSGGTAPAAETMMQEAGFVVLDTLFAPCTGATLERARRLNLTVSAAVIATK